MLVRVAHKSGAKIPHLLLFGESIFWERHPQSGLEIGRPGAMSEMAFAEMERAVAGPESVSGSIDRELEIVGFDQVPDALGKRIDGDVAGSMLVKVKVWRTEFLDASVGPSPPGNSA